MLSDYRQLVLAQTAVARELGLSPAARMAIKANSTNAALDLVGEFARDASAARLVGSDGAASSIRKGIR